jgi:hypothetical protein
MTARRGNTREQPVNLDPTIYFLKKSRKKQKGKQFLYPQHGSDGMFDCLADYFFAVGIFSIFFSKSRGQLIYIYIYIYN